jgi:hypothetical protein
MGAYEQFIIEAGDEIYLPPEIIIARVIVFGVDSYATN